MVSVQELESEINQLKNRNKKVEADKAWETSWTRKILIAVLTYFVIGIFFYYSGVSQPFKNALVPSLAFILSTLSIPFFKNFWIKKIYKN